VAGGLLNAARQSGGALGVALLGSLLGSSSGTSSHGSASGHAPNLHLPLAVGAALYLLALLIARLTIRPARAKS
jgi:hypothetical protein